MQQVGTLLLEQLGDLRQPEHLPRPVVMFTQLEPPEELFRVALALMEMAIRQGQWERPPDMGAAVDRMATYALCLRLPTPHPTPRPTATHPETLEEDDAFTINLGLATSIVAGRPPRFESAPIIPEWHATIGG